MLEYTKEQMLMIEALSIIDSLDDSVKFQILAMIELEIKSAWIDGYNSNKLEQLK